MRKISDCKFRFSRLHLAGRRISNFSAKYRRWTKDLQGGCTRTMMQRCRWFIGIKNSLLQLLEAGNANALMSFYLIFKLICRCVLVFWKYVSSELIVRRADAKIMNSKSMWKYLIKEVLGPLRAPNSSGQPSFWPFWPAWLRPSCLQHLGCVTLLLPGELNILQIQWEG